MYALKFQIIMLIIIFVFYSVKMELMQILLQELELVLVFVRTDYLAIQ